MVLQNTDITFFWDLPAFKYVSFSFTSLRKYWPRWLRCFKTFMKWHFFQQFPAFSSWQECITPYLVSLFLTSLSLNDLTDFPLFSCFLTIAYFSVVQKFLCFFYVGVGRFIFFDKFHVFHHINTSYFFVSLDSFYRCWNLLKEWFCISFITSYSYSMKQNLFKVGLLILCFLITQMGKNCWITKKRNQNSLKLCSHWLSPLEIL